MSPPPPLALPLAAALAAGVALAGCRDPGQAALARGHVLAARRQEREAAAAYQAAAQAAPGLARPRELLGHLLLRQGRPLEARAAYEEALRVEPQAALEAEIGLARLEADAGRPDEALSRLGRVLERQPGNLFALVSRANLALERSREGDAALAVMDTARALAVDGRSLPVLYARGRALTASGRFDEATLAFAQLRTAHPHSHLPDYGEARLAALQGDKAGALERLRRARQRATDRGAWRPDAVLTDPAFRALREDPELIATVRP